MTSGRTAAAFKGALLSDYALTPDQQGARAAAEQEVVKALTGAADAQGKLADRQATINEALLKGLAGEADRFLARLRDELSALRLTDLQVRQGDAGRRLGELREQAGGFDLLARAGVTTDDQLDRLKARRAEVQNYATAQQQAAQLEGVRRAAFDRLRVPGALAGLGLDEGDLDFSFFSPNRKGPQAGGVTGGSGLNRPTLLKASAFLESNLSDLLTPEQRGRALGRFQTEGYDSARAAYSQARQDGADRNVAVRAALESSLRSAVNSVVSGDAQTAVNDRLRAEKGLSAVGLNPEGFKGAVGTGGGVAFLKALDAFSAQTNPLSTFGDRLRQTAAEFDRLSEVVRRLSAAPAPAPPSGPGPTVPPTAYKAAGGSIFAPRGTDTVPAMLTPGEFVVSRDAAQKNHRLLRHLNDGGKVAFGGDDDQDGTHRKLAQADLVRLADGGLVGPLYAGGEFGDRPARRPRPDRRPPTPAELVEDRFQGTLANRLAAQLYAAAYQGLPGQDDQARAAVGATLARERDAERVFLTYHGDRTELARLALVGQPGFGTRQAFRAAAERDRRDREVQARTKRAFRAVFGNFNGADGPFLRRANWDAATRPGFAGGGLVGGAGSGDVVDARLEPGEFVLNKRAVQRASVTALAQQNAGNGPPAVQELGGAAELARALSGFPAPAESLASALRTFGDTSQRLADALDRMPQEVALQMAAFDINLNARGLEGLADLDERVKAAVAELVGGAVADAFDRRLPDAPRSVSGRTVRPNR